MPGVPKRWENYFPVGRRVSGTRFLPFKVPLKIELCRRMPEDEWFTPGLLIDTTPRLKAVIDLTDTNRYYNSEEFTSRGVIYKKINIVGGGKLPSKFKRKEFFDAVDQLLEMLVHDSDALIGVHCTHGLNRTGYLICKYMVSRMKIDPKEAIRKFQEARGYPIERNVYLDDIIFHTNNSHNQGGTRNYQSHSSTYENWRTEPRLSLSTNRPFRYHYKARTSKSNRWRDY